MTNNNLRAGYINRPDSMRDLADELFDFQGQKANSLYKKGGVAKSKKMKCAEGDNKFAAGGAAKVRKGVCTADGTPKNQPRNKRG